MMRVRSSALSLPDLVKLCRRRGFIFPGSDIYGGLASTYDYGPLGAQLKKNVVDSWWSFFVERKADVVGIDSSILLHPSVWKTSGHVEQFTDPLFECRSCQARGRVDKVLEDDHGIPPEEVAALVEDVQLLSKKLREVGAKCDECGSSDLSDVRAFNMLMKTRLGAAEKIASGSDKPLSADGDDDSDVFLRAETAQGCFINFANVSSAIRGKMPFGVAQVGKAFRNEISPGNFIFRTREFEMLEMQYFCREDESVEQYGRWREESLQWLHAQGLSESMIREREYSDDEVAHYASATTDLEYKFPFGWGEIVGVAARGDFDLSRRCHIENGSIFALD